MQGYTTNRTVIPFPDRGIEPRSAVIYRLPEHPDDAAAVLANLESRGVTYQAPIDVQRQLWARSRSYAKLAHRMASRGSVTA